MKTDILIIGTGLNGAAIARELSKYKINITAVEAASDVCGGTSKATSAIVHSGFHEQPGTLKAKLGVKSNAMFEDICKDLEVPFARVGSLLVASSEEDRKILEFKKKQGAENGIEGLRIIEADELHKMEPHFSGEAVAALYAPTGGIVGPFELAIALMENACANGVKLMKDAPVTGIRRVGDRWSVKTAKGDIETACVINAAGVHADEIASMVGDDTFTINPLRGEVYLLDRNVGDLVSHPIETVSLGIVAIPTVHGNVIIGTTREAAEKDNFDTTRSAFQTIFPKAKKLLPELSDKTLITSFAGLRAMNDRTEDFIIEASSKAENFVNVSVGTPGVFATFGIAEEVKEIVESLGFALEKKTDFIQKRKAIVDFKTLSEAERNELIKADERYGRVICRCETVTEGQIVEAIKRGATTLDGIKYRTRCGMGRCQGGFCTPRILRIMSRELNIPITKITKKGRNSELMPYKAKEFLQS